MFLHSSILLRLLAIILLGNPLPATTTTSDLSPAQIAFEQADKRDWKATFTDSGQRDWREKWFLDGEVGTITHCETGMKLRSGAEYKNQAHHMVLWTQKSFEGDLKIEYDFTRLDTDGVGVFILYIQATGSGEEGFAQDISEWSDFRQIPTMSKYFKNMNTYHISYGGGYIRARRYNTELKRMNGHSELIPDYLQLDDLFTPGERHRLTCIKTESEIFLRISNTKVTRYFHMVNEDWPTVNHGRIGLRQMYTKAGRYSDIKVSVPH